MPASTPRDDEVTAQPLGESMVASLIAPGETYTNLLNKHPSNAPAAALAALVAHAVWKLDNAHDTLRAKARLGAALLTRVANGEAVPAQRLDETTREIASLAAAVKTHRGQLSLLVGTYDTAIRHLPAPQPPAALRSTFTQASMSVVEVVQSRPTTPDTAPEHGSARR